MTDNYHGWQHGPTVAFFFATGVILRDYFLRMRDRYFPVIVAEYKSTGLNLAGNNPDKALPIGFW